MDRLLLVNKIYFILLLLIFCSCSDTDEENFIKKLDIYDGPGVMGYCGLGIGFIIHIDNDPKALMQETIGGTVGGSATALVFNSIYDPPHKVQIDSKISSTQEISGVLARTAKGQGAIYRWGGLLDYLGAAPHVIGNDIYFGRNPNPSLQAHELFHLYQQASLGWSNFYGKALFHEQIWMRMIIRVDPYSTPGCLENDATDFENILRQ